ncbi:MAG TPA: NAD(P)-dependent oxidoreductase [Phototrophicaceae bacterium]|nr:NAD(P)-dependent oxidoreductase [Phototrophicaceae bacterium]
MQRIALLGLGIMGSGMASNWLRKGFPLTVYNRTRSKAEPFAAKDARIADTPREAAQDADIIVAMVTDDDASREVWLGENGALANAKAGAIIVESSTISPDWTRELANRVEAQGCFYLDVPVTGSKAAASDGNLVLFVGGEASTLEQARPALEAISRQINHVGEIGMGATWKLINNMQLAVQIVAVSEALALAEKAGFNLQQASQLIVNSAASSPFVQGKMPRLIQHDFGDTEFSLSNMLKDTRYALKVGEQLGVPLGAVEAASEVFRRASEQGHGDEDVAAVIAGVNA